MIGRFGYIVAPFSLPNGREVSITPLTFGRARITVGPPGGDTIDTGF